MKDIMVLFSGFMATMAIIIGASLLVIQPLSESSLQAAAEQAEIVLSSTQTTQDVTAF